MFFDVFQKSYSLKLLFDCKNGIHRRDYFVGQVLLALIIILGVLFITHEAFFWVPVNMFKNSPHLVSQFTDNFLYQCSPFLLIILYSSFALAFKRGKTLGLNKWIRYILGLFSFLFYLVIVLILSTYSHVTYHESPEQTFLENIYLILIILGLISICFLCFWGKEKDDSAFKYEDRKQVLFLFRLSLLHGSTAIMSWLCYTKIIDRPMILESPASIPIVLETCYFLFLILKRIMNVRLSLTVFFSLFFIAFLFQILNACFNPYLFHLCNYNDLYFVNIIDCSTYLFAFILLSSFVLFCPSVIQGNE